MNYYYEINLNFLNNLYSFYEWHEEDKLYYFKKIPLYLLQTKKFNKLVGNKINVKLEFLNQLENRAILNTGIVKYACIFTDGSNAVGIIFNNKGDSIFYSSLTIEDELNIEESSYTFKIKDIDFSIIESLSKSKSNRIMSKIKKYIICEIKTLIEHKNNTKLQYLYYEAFKENETDQKKILKKINEKINENESNEIYNLYNIIKLSYKNV